MKKTILLILSLCLMAIATAQTTLTVASTAGGLSTAITTAGGTLSTVTNLTITGTIDASDFLTMRTNMPSLSVINLTAVTIAPYTGTGGTQGSDSNYGYPANTIPVMAFYECEHLTSVTLPSSVTSIGEGAFEGCNALTSINIPSSVTSIESYAFENSLALTSITIPSSVISIQTSAFWGCSALITVDANNPNYSSVDGVLFNENKTTLIQCPSSKTGSYTIPSSVDSIGQGAFANCVSLISVTIPASVTYIAALAFISCRSLTSIYSDATTPVDLTSSSAIFVGVNTPTCTLYVPLNSASLYQAANQWQDFLNIVEVKATATISLSSLNATYDGTPQTITATTTPAGLNVTITYNGSTTVPSAVGTYPIVATINDTNYQGSATATLVIAKATAIITLSDSTAIYDGTPQTITATTTPAGLNVTITYNGSTTVPTDAGTYPIVATITDPNYQGSATSTLVISKATATITLTDSTAYYDGTPTPKTITATTAPAGLNMTITYNGSTTAPSAVGTYPVVATIDDPNYQGSATGNLFILIKATATITLSDSTATYDGTPKTITATTIPAGLNVTITYNGSTTAPTDPGTYPIVATITDPSYQGSVTETLVIFKATATITLSDSTATYDGTPKTVTATTTPAGLNVTITYNGSTTAPTTVGTYPIVATFDNPNYQGSATETLVIFKATATITLSDSTATYDGTPQTIIATTTPAGLNVTITYNGSTTAPTDAGTYPIVATFDNPNYQGSATATLVISKATASVSFNSLTPTYDGTPKILFTPTTPTGLTVNITYNGSTTAPSAVGTYPVVATIDDANYQGSATATLVIAKATATISLSGVIPYTYDGTPKTVTPTTTPSGLTVNITYNGSTTAPSAVGTYNVVATIDDANYQGTAIGSFVISPATGTINTQTTAVDIIAYNDIIKISGVKIGDIISVYTPNGTLYFNTKATQETEYIYSLKTGLYIVSVPAQNIARKVLIN